VKYRGVRETNERLGRYLRRQRFSPSEQRFCFFQETERELVREKGEFEELLFVTGSVSSSGKPTMSVVSSAAVVVFSRCH